MKHLEEMTRREFEALPWRDNWAEEMLCDQIVILPSKISCWRFWWYQVRYWLAHSLYRLRNRSRFAMRSMLGLPEDRDWQPPELWQVVPGIHDSNYRCIDYVAISNGKAICRLSGCSDVLHIDGIGGYGYRWLRQGGVPSFIAVAGWQMDCLPTSGLLRLWPSSRRHIIVGSAVSSFEIYATDCEELTEESLGWEEHLAQSKALLEASQT